MILFAVNSILRVFNINGQTEVISAELNSAENGKTLLVSAYVNFNGGDFQVL